MFEFRLAGHPIRATRKRKMGPAKTRARSAIGDAAPAMPGSLDDALRGLLTPVDPPTSFRDELARELAAVARHKKSPQILLQRPPDYRRGFLIGALLSSAVSLAGVIAVIWRRRAQHPSSPPC